ESNAGEFKNVVTDYYTSTDGNGNKTYAAATATVAAPAGATSLDLRNTSTVTTVTPSSNPNCVYLLNESASVPSGLSTNVVKGTTAESVTLTDGYDFSSPISFQATSISYTRTFTTGVGASSGGWSTIVLPFDVTSVTVGGEAKDWFHSSTDTGKHFWAKSFTSDGASTVYFGYATSLKANTPYIIAVPGEEWGSAWQLTGKAMTFTGSNCTITAGTAAQVAGASYKFAGGTSSQTVSGYMLNSAGTKFEMATGATLDAFRACFLSTTSSSLGSTLSIGSDDGTTGICLPGVELQQELRGPIYRLNGQRVSDDASTFDQLPHGVYIINGKKVIK
ncbi:MAG: hypothetical protein K5764_04020, partial [Prevotella sp.]|nr:hypothetical protein [Prevotella sp.]